MRWDNKKGFLLHSAPYGETSLLVDLYTHEYGRVRCIAKGFRKPNKRGGSRSIFPHLEYLFNWHGRSELKTLSSAEALETPKFLQEDSLYVGLYINELIYRLFAVQDSSENFYYEYKKFVNNLFRCGPTEPQLRTIEIKLLRELGYGLVLDSEAGTGNRLEPDRYYSYVPQTGLKSMEDKTVKNCLLGRDLLDLVDGNFSTATSLKTARIVLRAAIDFYLEGKPIHSRKLYSDYKKSLTNVSMD